MLNAAQVGARGGIHKQILLAKLYKTACQHLGLQGLNNTGFGRKASASVQKDLHRFRSLGQCRKGAGISARKIKHQHRQHQRQRRRVANFSVLPFAVQLFDISQLSAGVLLFLHAFRPLFMQALYYMYF